MTANRGLFVRNNGTTGTTPIEGRLVLASLVAENSPGVPRNGLLDQKATNVVTGSASNMSYNVAACNPVINRATNEGVYMLTLTGTTNVVTDAAPGTGSRWDLIYVKQDDLDKGDADNLPVVGVQKGTAAASPTKPYASLPAGAYVLAEAQVSAGAANAASAQVTITQVWRYTALRGAPIPVRNTTERDEITPAAGTSIKRLDLAQNAIQTYDGSKWIYPTPKRYAELYNNGFTTGAGTLWDVGPLTLDSAKSTNNTFVTPDSVNGQVIIQEDGLYAISSVTLPTNNPGQHYGFIKIVATNESIAGESGPTNGAWEVALVTPAVYLTAGTKLLFRLWTANASTINTRVRIFKITD